jgi:hypothetical protein
MPALRCSHVLRIALCILVTSAAIFTSQAHAQNRPAGRTKIGRIKAMSGRVPPGSPPQDQLSFTVFPNVQILVDAWVEYDTSTCAEISPGSWTITTPPTNGVTATGIVSGSLGNGDCPGDTFQFAAIYYTWTSTTPNVTTDSFAATWTSPDFQVMDDVSLTLASAQVTSADLVQNQVNVTLTGPGLSGVLTIAVNGDSNTYTVNANSGNAVGPGTYPVPLVRPDIVQDTYSSITATWNVGTTPPTNTFNLSPPWYVSGITQNTVYVKVYESACSGTPTTGYWTFDQSTCVFTPVNLKPLFASQTYLNGTGLTLGGILVHQNPGLCKRHLPQGATKQNTFYTISEVTGACGAMSDNDVAVYPNPQSVGDPYSCDDQLLYVSKRNNNALYPQTVEDYCPACKNHSAGTTAHVDNYFDDNTCTHSSMPDYWEADLGSGSDQVRVPVPVANGSSGDSQAAVPKQAFYKDNEVKVQSRTVNDSLVLSIDSVVLRKDVQLPDTVNAITEIRRYADRIVAIGSENASASRVLIIDLEHGVILDSFDAFYPAISPDGRFIAYVKFYPPHFVKGTDDHDMLYDVAKSATGNRPASVPLDDLVNVGVNVYPGGQNKEDDNVGVPADRAHGTVSPFFWGPDSQKLIFADQTQSLRLVEVKVSESNPGAAPTALVAPLDKTSVCAAPLMANLHCQGHLDQVEFHEKGVETHFSGVGTKGSIHRDLFVKIGEFVAPPQ